MSDKKLDIKSQLELALTHLKAGLGISGTHRDEYLLNILESVVSELTDINGINIEMDNTVHMMFVVDLSDFRYSNRDNPDGLPRNLQHRFHNLLIEGKRSD